jgi:hypothetical protein
MTRPDLIVTLLVILLLLCPPRAASAQEAAAEPAWELAALSGPVQRLFTPASGAFFATTKVGLFRSDDGGTSWAAVSLPPDTYAVVPDPLDHTTLYAAGAGGLHKTGDDAATWTLILPTAEAVRAVAVSPANRSLVYLGLAGSRGPSTDFRFLRSRDGGTTWEQLEEHHNSLCGWAVRLLVPHPADEARAFRTAGCYAGRNIGDALQESADAGATWTASFRPDSAFPDWLVGGQGVSPDRFYLGANRDFRGGGSLVYRSDDGQHWTEILGYRGGGSIQEPTLPNVTLGGLAYDPAAADRVFVGLNVRPSDGTDRTTSVKRSVDGGSTWTDLGRPDLGPINDVVLGVDGLNLYVATDHGLWRLPLAAPDRPACQVGKRLNAGFFAPFLSIRPNSGTIPSE